MLKASTRTTYGLRALIEMVRSEQKGPIQLAGLAANEHIPLPYLQQIFSRLKKAGLVKTIRGPHGGYLLSKDPAEISLAEIVTTLEGPLEPALCIYPENRTADCHEVDGCNNRVLCHDLDGAIYNVLYNKTLSSLSTENTQISKV